jgi:polysaccharide export outer membrane protein
MSLQAALAQAGGEGPDAGATIEIHRHDTAPNVFENVSNTRADQSRFGSIMVGPGDVVDVHRAGIIYVLGAVHRPGGYLMVNRGSLNVLEALALAQGTLLEASTGSIRVLHRDGDKITEEPFRLDPATKGTDTPPALHDTDIVYVPASKAKSVLVNGAAIIGAATSSIIYRVY